MGRGGGGGGHGGGGGGHHGGGGFHSSRSHSSSGFGRSSSSGFHHSSSYHHHHYYSYPRFRRTVYYGGTGRGVSTSAGNPGCLTVFICIFILLFVCVSLSKCSFAGHKAYIDEEVVGAQSEAYFNDNFKGNENVFLFYIAYSDNLDDEYQYIRYGSETESIMDMTYDRFFDYYRMNYNDDVGIQLTNALADFYNNEISGKFEPVKKNVKFSSKMIYDELGWIDSKNMLQTTANSFYDYTGIQFATAVVNYDKLPGANTDNTKIFIVFIISAGVVVGIYIGYRWWKKKKEQKNKEAEDAIRILNTPLDQFNSINNLTQKYDSPTSSVPTKPQQTYFDRSQYEEVKVDDNNKAVSDANEINNQINNFDDLADFYNENINPDDDSVF